MFSSDTWDQNLGPIYYKIKCQNPWLFTPLVSKIFESQKLLTVSISVSAFWNVGEMNLAFFRKFMLGGPVLIEAQLPFWEAKKMPKPFQRQGATFIGTQFMWMLFRQL